MTCHPPYRYTDIRRNESIQLHYEDHCIALNTIGHRDPMNPTYHEINLPVHEVQALISSLTEMVNHILNHPAPIMDVEILESEPS